MGFAADSSNGRKYTDVTSWPTVLLAIAAGALAAFQVGKVHIALPSPRQSFSLSLVNASWLLSALNIVGLFAATRTWSVRLGNKRSVIVGLLVMMLASGTGKQFREVVTSRGPVLLAIIFGMYAMQHLSVMGFMPTLLHDRFRLPEARIGALVAVAMASNIIGNLAAGALLQRGIARGRMITFTSVFMALMTGGMFLVRLPFQEFYACMFAFSCVGGIVPSAVMGAAPFHTPTPLLLGATNGLLVQGSNLGIAVRPPLMSPIVIRLGWNWVPAMTGIAAAMAAVLALNMRSTTHFNPDFEATAQAL